MLNKTHKKISSKTYKEFKTFTGLSYYQEWYKKKPFRNNHSFGSSIDGQRIWLPFWVDNYKRLNALHNKIMNKVDVLNKEISTLTKPIFKESDKQHRKYYHLEGDLLYNITIHNFEKKFSYGYDLASNVVDSESRFFNKSTDRDEEETEETEETLDKLKEIFTKYFFLNKKREKYFKYLSLIVMSLKKVLGDIINYKIKDSFPKNEYDKQVFLNIDDDKIVCNIKRDYKDGPINCTSFSKNIMTISI